MIRSCIFPPSLFPIKQFIYCIWWRTK